MKSTNITHICVGETLPVLMLSSIPQVMDLCAQWQSEIHALNIKTSFARSYVDSAVVTFPRHKRSR